ncbi:hypothetical protein E3U55_14495 [Filobacillus milosensis]|uniref:DUF1643 domain-containing protein n=1 Tax=Filobacillus milosensis TaxID=94137 RepID=A0A4Y8IDX3_9BACI|nr:hypothetical protein [Filobacillus milosensis]TFB14120.1 hypothetical protein E3U55_14495 [Filobacillus milosensis]
MSASELEFKSQIELDSLFNVFGKFYDVKIGNHTFKCRSQAIIEREGTNQNQYDALFVLMNPGSCEPVSEVAVPSIHSESEIMNLNPTPAKCDPTQYQIMRLMELRGWNKTVIINLSDLRSGNADKFYLDLLRADDYAFRFHSIFSDLRKSEREKVIEDCMGPIILGWGVKNKIKHLAFEALSKLFPYTYFGIKKQDEGCLYYHPNPQIFNDKKIWLHTMNLILSENQKE